MALSSSEHGTEYFGDGTQEQADELFAKLLASAREHTEQDGIVRQVSYEIRPAAPETPEAPQAGTAPGAAPAASGAPTASAGAPKRPPAARYESVASMRKRLRSVQIECAGALAEREKAVEMLERVAAGNSKQIQAIGGRLRAVGLRESDEITALRRRLELECQGSRQLRGQMNTLRTKIVEQARRIEDISRQADEHIAEAQDSARETIVTERARLHGEVQAQAVREYADRKIKTSGLALHENTRALLGQCRTTAEVDKVFEDVIDALRVSALHGGDSGGTTIVAETIDDGPPEDPIVERAGKILRHIMG
ncbi:MAG: hypothetical protein ABFD90_11455 [Phycisphaerales bacterium]